MKELLFATNNQNKVFEIQVAIGSIIKVISLTDAGIDIDIPEPHHTIDANAAEKSRTIHTLTGRDCFGEDTALEVDWLQGEPGVKSARYAGDDKNFNKNIQKLLANLVHAKNRKARFRTVICLIYQGNEFFFQGICDGEIIESKRGFKGFGYDSVFVPYGSKRTFAEMDTIEKNQFSHRKKAADKLVLFLQQQTGVTRTN